MREADESRWSALMVSAQAGNSDDYRVLLEELGDGLYINNVWYLNFSDRPACRITGMTRFACFWVEGGEIAYPVNEITIAGNLRDMLRTIVPANDARPHGSSPASSSPSASSRQSGGCW